MGTWAHLRRSETFEPLLVCCHSSKLISHEWIRILELLGQKGLVFWAAEKGIEKSSRVMFWVRDIAHFRDIFGEKSASGKLKVESWTRLNLFTEENSTGDQWRAKKWNLHFAESEFVQTNLSFLPGPSWALAFMGSIQLVGEQLWSVAHNPPLSRAKPCFRVMLLTSL